MRAGPQWDNDDLKLGWLIYLLFLGGMTGYWFVNHVSGRWSMPPWFMLASLPVLSVLFLVGAWRLWVRDVRAQWFGASALALFVIVRAAEMVLVPSTRGSWIVVACAAVSAVVFWFSERREYEADSFRDVVRKPWKRRIAGEMLREQRERPRVDLSEWDDEKVWSYAKAQLRTTETFPFNQVADDSLHRLQPALRRALREPWIAKKRRTAHAMERDRAIFAVLNHLEPTPDDRPVLREWAEHDDDSIARHAMRVLVRVATVDDVDHMARRWPGFQFQKLEESILSCARRGQLESTVRERIVDHLLRHWNDGHRVNPDALQLAATCDLARVQSWVEGYPDPTEARRAYLLVDGCLRAELALPMDRVRSLLDVPWPDDVDERDRRFNDDWRTELLIRALLRSDRAAARETLDAALARGSTRSLNTLIDFDLEWRGLPPRRALYQVLNDARSSPGGLTWQQQVYEDIVGLERQVCNGGFTQWFFNGYGVRWSETIRALEEIEAPGAAAIVREACAMFGPDGPGADRDTVERRLSQLPKDVLDGFEELDTAYYPRTDRLMLRLHEYCLKHREHFWDRAEAEGR